MPVLSAFLCSVYSDSEILSNSFNRHVPHVWAVNVSCSFYAEVSMNGTHSGVGDFVSFLLYNSSLMKYPHHSTRLADRGAVAYQDAPMKCRNN